MAKGNLILGTAKNSVGDVVMYRREGAQITRVRVRNVKNPKTNAQSFQRAIMAPIAKFYSALSVVLERSYEGLSKAKSHNKFNQTNANLARKNKWALPKGTGFFPLPYQLSQGTLPTVNYKAEGAFIVTIPGVTKQTSTIAALSTALVDAGYKQGDVVTIIAITVVMDSSTVKEAVPHSLQFAIDTTSVQSFAEAFGSNVEFDNQEDNLIIPLINKTTVLAGAIIVSRFDGNMWRRSTQALAVDNSITTSVTADAAVAAAIASYGMTAGDGNPLVYLDGDELTDGQ